MSIPDFIHISLLAAAFGALVGVTATVVTGWALRKKTAAMSWEVLNSEIQLCHQMAVAYLDTLRRTGINLPLSRWPTTFYVEMLKTIVAEREIASEEVQPIMQFYNMVDQINLAFEHANKAREHLVTKQNLQNNRRTRWAMASTRTAPPVGSTLVGQVLGQEMVRIQLKAQHLVGINGDPHDVYTAANRIAQRNCQRFKKLFWRILFLQFLK